MDENKFREKLTEWDRKSLDDRVERWKQIVPAIYDVPLPELVWGYLSEVDEMYIAGHFIGVVLLCAGIAELVLADQIRVRTGMTAREVERFTLEQLAILGRRLSVVEEAEMGRLNELRKQRNYLVHGKAGRLAQMAKKRYRASGPDDSFLNAEFYVRSGFAGGIDQDACQHLRLIRDLTVRFYGAKP